MISVLSSQSGAAQSRSPASLRNFVVFSTLAILRDQRF
jgi:hypothetical protein